MVLKKVLVAVGAAVVVAVGGSKIQLVGRAGVPGSGRSILGEAQIDPGTLGLVQRACQNCHSETTMWPWYGRVPPVSWLLADDVEQARVHMNLTAWPEYASETRFQLLSAIGSAVRNRAMPPQRYLWLHPEARLTDLEREQIYAWTRRERRREVRLPVPGQPGDRGPNSPGPVPSSQMLRRDPTTSSLVPVPDVMAGNRP